MGQLGVRVRLREDGVDARRRQVRIVWSGGGAGDQDHGTPGPQAAEICCEVASWPVRQAVVDAHQVPVVGFHGRQRGCCVGHGLNAWGVQAKPPAEDGPKDRIVLHDQDREGRQAGGEIVVGGRSEAALAVKPR